MDMELREFVKQALVNIVGAVSDAAAEVKEQGTGAIISPRLNQSETDAVLRVAPEDGHGYAFPVKFDLTVTVSSTESQKTDMGGGFKISIMSARAGHEDVAGEAKTAVQRIQFSVPVKFPQTPREPAPPREIWRGR